MDEAEMTIQFLEDKLRQAETDIRLVMRTGLACCICKKADGDCDRISGCNPIWRYSDA